MAQLLEPFPLGIERSSVSRLGRDVQPVIDYSKLPRSSGDGMEFTISNSSEESSSEEIDKDGSTLSYRTSSKCTGNHTVDHLHGNRSVPQARFTSRVGNKGDDLQPTPSEGKTLCSDTAAAESSKLKINPGNQTIRAAARDKTGRGTHPEQIIHCQNSVNLLLQSADLPGLDSHPGLSFRGSCQVVSLAPPAADLTFTDSLMKSTVLEQNAKYVDSWKVINDLEEQNAKFVEEKTKLTVQLGIQTKVNADIKKLLVASVGEDVCYRLEDLVTRNTQQAVELNHWKKMCEEYSEESDRLEIECDVWRTKFLASRMMSDELSSWKVALYTRFRQAQSALERLLHERSELQQYLIQTRRLIHSLHSILKCTNGRQPNVATEQHTSHEQSILEMASVNTSLARETWDLAESVLPTLSLSEASMMLTQSQESSGQEQHLEPTPAEKLAIQVLSDDVDLQAEEEQLQGVMKRMGKQYIGHGYHGRFSTKNFRVTYDCCNRCSGALHVV